MAEELLTHAAALKEANVIARELQKSVTYQFTVIQARPLGLTTSAFDGIVGLSHDECNIDIDSGVQDKPSVGIKVYDQRPESTCYVWSVKHFLKQLDIMRGLYRYINKPYAQHMDFQNPFYNDPAPQLSFVGQTSIALWPLCRNMASTRFAPILCSLLGFEQIGQCEVIIRPLSLVRSSNIKPLNGHRTEMVTLGSIITLEVQVNTIQGFSSSLMRSMHCQFRLSALRDNFTEIDQIYSSSVQPLTSIDAFSFRKTIAIEVDEPQLRHLQNGMLHIEFYAAISSAFLHRLDRADQSLSLGNRFTSSSLQAGRRPEAEFLLAQHHDVSVSIEICELDASANYVPCTVTKKGSQDPGAFWLSQGKFYLAVAVPQG